MKNIFFNEIKFKSLSGIFILIALILNLISLFGALEIFAIKNHNLISSISSLFIAIYFSKKFWYKNYAEWNKKGMNLKINEFWGKQIIFDFVSRVDFDNETQILKIIDNRGFEKIFNTTGIQDQDIDKLLAILYENAGLEVVESNV